MSIQIQKEALELINQGEQMQTAMHTKAGEMIELMKIVRADALRRRNQYRKMAVAMKAGQLREVKRLNAEMGDWRKHKLVI